MKKIFALNLVLFLFSFSIIKAQRIDSLKQRLQQSKPDTNRIKILANLSQLYSIKGDTSNGLKYAREAEKLSLKIDSKPGLANAYLMFGVAFWFANKWDSAIAYHNKEIKLRRSLGNEIKLTDALNRAGDSYWAKEDYYNAVQSYIEAVSINKKINNLRGVGDNFANIAGVFANFRMDSLAINYFDSSIIIANRIKDTILEAYNYVNLAGLYLREKSYSSSINYYNKALRIFSNSPNRKHEKFVTLSGIGALYSDMGNADSAIFYFNLCKSFSEFYDLDISTKTMAMGNSASIYYHMGDYNKAITLSLQALDLATKFNLKELIIQNRYNLTELNLKKGNAQEALKYFIGYKNLSDSFFVDNTYKISKGAVVFVTKIMDKINSDLKEDIKKQKEKSFLFISICVIIAAFLLVAVFLYYDQHKANLKLKIESINYKVSTVKLNNFLAGIENIKKEISIKKSEIENNTEVFISYLTTSLDFIKKSMKDKETKSIKKIKSDIRRHYLRIQEPLSLIDINNSEIEVLEKELSLSLLESTHTSGKKTLIEGRNLILAMFINFFALFIVSILSAIFGLHSLEPWALIIGLIVSAILSYLNRRIW